MAALRQTIRDEAFEEAGESFAYTTTTQHPDWDLSYLGDHLATQITEWRAELLIEQPPTEGHPAARILPVEEVQEVPAPQPNGLPEQVIEGNQEPVVWPAESDASMSKLIIMMAL